MPWIALEYVLKGLFLGLLLASAWQAPGSVPALIRGASMALGLGGALVIGAAQPWREGVRPKGNWLPYLLYLLLDNPRLIYGGILLGLSAGCIATRNGASDTPLTLGAIGGALVGVAGIALRVATPKKWRFGLALAAAVALVGPALYAFEMYPDSVPEGAARSMGWMLLLGLPFYYLLTLAGEAEETEGDAASWCAALAISVWLIRLTPNVPAMALFFPIALYILYTKRILPGLRVFKHVLRGMSFSRMGRYRDALVVLNRAGQLDPNNGLRRQVLWDLHRRLDPHTIVGDPDIAELIDPSLCLDRVAELLTPGKPSERSLSEATHLLDLVQQRQPDLAAPVLYWRCVAATHAGQLDAAADSLVQLLDPLRWRADDAARAGILFPAWQLALASHPELKRRVGDTQLPLPGRRLEAIGAVERQLALAPDPEITATLKRPLYLGLTEAELLAGPVTEIDADAIRHAGQSLAEHATQWPRGIEYLRMAAHLAPADAPALWHTIAELHRAHGQPDEARRALDEGLRAAEAHGVTELPEPSRHAYYGTLKTRADEALAQQDWPTATLRLQRYAPYERSGVETLKLLADLHEKQGQPLAALKATEQGLLFNSQEPELLEKRDKYHYSVFPADLAQASDAAKQAVNYDYCVTKARTLLQGRELDAELVDWAEHLAQLASILKPDAVAPRVLVARTQLLRGHRDEAVVSLQNVMASKPELFSGKEESDSYYLGCRLLGDLYLKELNLPERAIECFTEYRASSQSGADTLYKLGEACEQLGQFGPASKWYQQVTGYTTHPLAYDAQRGLERCKEAASAGV